MQRNKLLILLRGLWLSPNSTGGLVKDITFPGPSLCRATYADCLRSAINQVQETGGFCVQSIHMHRCVLSQEVDQSNGIRGLDLGG